MLYNIIAKKKKKSISLKLAPPLAIYNFLASNLFSGMWLKEETMTLISFVFNKPFFDINIENSKCVFKYL